MAKERNTKYSPFSCSNENVQIYKRNKTNEKDGDSSSLSISCDFKGRILVKNGDEEKQQSDSEQSQQHKTNQFKKEEESENIKNKMSSENAPKVIDTHQLSEKKVGESIRVDKAISKKEASKYMESANKTVEKCKYPYYGKRFYCSGYGAEVSAYNKSKNVKPQASNYGGYYHTNYNYYGDSYPKFGKFKSELKGKAKFASMYNSSFNNNQKGNMDNTNGENKANNSNTGKYKNSNFAYDRIMQSYRNPYFYKRVNHKTNSGSSYNKYNYPYDMLYKYGRGKDESSNYMKYYNKKYARDWKYSHSNAYSSALGKRTVKKSKVPKIEKTEKKNSTSASISSISNFLKGWTKPKENDPETSKKEKNVVSISKLYKYFFTNSEDENSKERDVSDEQKEQSSSDAIDPLESTSKCMKPIRVLMHKNKDLGKQNEKEIEKEKEKEKRHRMEKESVKERSKERSKERKKGEEKKKANGQKGVKPKKYTSADIDSSESSDSNDNCKIKELSKFLFRDPFKGPLTGPTDSFFKDESNRSSSYERNEFAYIEPVNYYKPKNVIDTVVHHSSKKESKENCLCPLQRGKKKGNSEESKPKQAEMEISLHTKKCDEIPKTMKPIEEIENSIINKITCGNTNAQTKINEDKNANLKTTDRYKRGVHIKENDIKTGNIKKGFPFKSVINAQSPKITIKSVHSHTTGANISNANVTKSGQGPSFKEVITTNITREKECSPEVKKALNKNNSVNHYNKVNNMDNNNNNVNNVHNNNNNKDKNSHTQRNGNITATNDPQNKNVKIDLSNIKREDTLNELVSCVGKNAKESVIETGAVKASEGTENMFGKIASRSSDVSSYIKEKCKTNKKIVEKKLIITVLDEPNKFKVIESNVEDSQINGQSSQNKQKVHYVTLGKTERFTLTNLLNACKKLKENELSETANDSDSDNRYFEKKTTEHINKVEQELKQFSSTHVEQCNYTSLDDLHKESISPNMDINDLYHDRNKIVPEQKKSNVFIKDGAPYNHNDEVIEKKWVTENILEKTKTAEEEEKEAKKIEEKAKQKGEERKKSADFNTLNVLNNALDTHNSESPSPNANDLNGATEEDIDELTFFNDLKVLVDNWCNSNSEHLLEMDPEPRLLIHRIKELNDDNERDRRYTDMTGPDIFFAKNKEPIAEEKYEEMFDEICGRILEKQYNYMLKKDENKKENSDSQSSLENQNGYNQADLPLSNDNVEYEQNYVGNGLNDTHNVQTPSDILNTNEPLYNTAVDNNTMENQTQHEKFINVQTNSVNENNCDNEVQELKQTMSDTVDVCVNGIYKLNQNSHVCDELDKAKEKITWRIIECREKQQILRDMLEERARNGVVNDVETNLELYMTDNNEEGRKYNHEKVIQNILARRALRDSTGDLNADLFQKVRNSECNSNSLLSQNIDELAGTKICTNFINSGEHGQAFSANRITNYTPPGMGVTTEVLGNDIELFDTGAILETIKPYRGKRKGLLVFLTYNGQLEGTKNDGLELCDILVEALEFDNLILLNDSYTHYKNFISEEATKKNVLTALNNFIQNSANGDVLFFYFSGFSIKLIDSKFPQVYNFALLPQDYLKNCYIYSNEIFNILRKLGGGRQLCIILDTTYSSNFVPVVSAITFNKQMGTSELYKNNALDTNNNKPFCPLRFYGKLRRKHVDPLYVENLQMPFNAEQYYYTQQIAGTYGTFSIPSVFLYSADSEDRNAYELVVQGRVRGLLTYCIIKGIALLKRNFTYHDLFLVISNLLKHIKDEYQLKYVKFKLSFMNEHSPDDIKFLAHEFILKQNTETPLWKHTLQMHNSGANTQQICEPGTTRPLNNGEVCNMVIFVKDIRLLYDFPMGPEGTFFISCFVVNEEICTWERRRYNTACTAKIGDKLFFLQELHFDKLDKSKEHICIELFQRRNINLFIGRTVLAIKENIGYFNLVDEQNSIIGVINVTMKKCE